MSLTYDMAVGPFGMCSSQFTNGVFTEANATDMYKCCLRICRPRIDECVKLCNQTETEIKENCYNTCDDISASCDDNCKLSTDYYWGVDNDIYKGTTKFGCGDGYYTAIDKKCMKENKDAIINVCTNNCLPTSIKNCEFHCGFSYDMLVNPQNDVLAFKKEIIVPHSRPASRSVTGYIIFCLVVIFLVTAYLRLI